MSVEYYKYLMAINGVECLISEPKESVMGVEVAVIIV